MPTQEEVNVFSTSSLVEATLMYMRLKGESMSCQWADGKCVFSFFDAGAKDIQWACNAKTEVVAREFNHAMTQVKSAMYASRHG